MGFSMWVDVKWGVRMGWVCNEVLYLVWSEMGIIIVGLQLNMEDGLDILSAYD